MAIDYRRKDFLARVRALTGEGVDVASTRSAALWPTVPCARSGPADGSFSIAARTPLCTGAELARGVRVVHGDRGGVLWGYCRPVGGCLPIASRNCACPIKIGSGGLRALLKLLREGKVHPVVAQRLPLSDAAARTNCSQSSASIGKLVFVPCDEDAP